MNPRTLVFDIDGTLCFDGVSISPAILTEIENLSRHSAIFFASARHPRDMVRLLPDSLIQCSALIGANGAICKRGETVLYLRPIQNRDVDSIITILDRHHCAYLIDGVEGYHKSTITHHFFGCIAPEGSCRERSIIALQKVGIIKFLVLSSSAENFEALYTEILMIPGLSLHKHSDGTFDITIASTDKYIALHEAFGIEEDFICFGNDDNDLPLFKKSAYAFLVGDKETLAPYADEQIRGIHQEETIENIVSILQKIYT